MSSLAYLFIALASVCAVLNWYSVGREKQILEYISKPAATIALLAVAASLDVTHDATWKWRIAALVLCLFGDVFLMLPTDAFVPGLASFAVAQVLFTISFATGDTTVARWIIGMLIAIPLASVLARRFVGGIKKSGHDELVAPVIIYMTVISAMAISSIANGNAIAIAGAFIFMVSDSLIAETRFVQEKNWHGVAIMVTYHFALAGLVFGLL